MNGEMTMTEPKQQARPTASLLPLLADIVIPIVGYFILHAFGVNDFWALTISGMACGVNAAAQTIRTRKLDGLGVLVLLEVTLSIVLLFVTRDPRIVLLKSGFYIAIGGLFTLCTLFGPKPLTYFTALPFATQGKPERIAAYERSWAEAPRFRSGLRRLAGLWGATFLLDAVIKTIIVFSFPASQVSSSLVLSNAPDIILLVLLIVVTKLLVNPLEKIINANVVPATAA
jgi:hypothetical protein